MALNLHCINCGRQMDFRKPQYKLQVTINEDWGDRDMRTMLLSMILCRPSCVTEAAEKFAASQQQAPAAEVAG